jgi:ribosomal protein RSM22 (predicted rRNA methylase)
MRYNYLGPGTAIWAAIDTYLPITKAYAIDTSQSMLALATDFAELYPDTSLTCKRYIDPSIRSDLVIASYSLSNLPGPAVFDDTVQRLWAGTDKYLLVVEKGTPDGFELIRKVRDALLKDGGQVIAPCLHNETCPISGADWCHFSQRMQRPKYLMKLKKSKSNMEDVKYSYILLAKPTIHASPEPDARRIVAPPMKRQGHVVLDTCAGSGKLERVTISKSAGEVYGYARKSYWGDVWTGGTGGGKVVVRERLSDVEEVKEAEDVEGGERRYARKRVGEIDFSGI